MESQKGFWIGNEVILWHHSLRCDAIIGASCQHHGNACQHKSRNSYYQVVFVLPCNILITIYITTANEAHNVFPWFSLKCSTKEAVMASFVEYPAPRPV